MRENEVGGAIRAASACGQAIPSIREGGTALRAPPMTFNPKPAAKPHCAARNKDGDPCKGWPAKSTPYCAGHLRQQGVI